MQTPAPRAPGRSWTAALAAALVCGCGAPRSTTPVASPAPVAATATRRTIAAATTGMERRDGFIPLYLDPAGGKLYLELPADSLRALFVATQPTGLGSNPVGIDRGGDAGAQVVRFDRSGDRVMVVFENWSYRGATDNPDHARTVAEAFPPSTVASLPVMASEGRRILVDATAFALTD